AARAASAAAAEAAAASATAAGLRPGALRPRTHYIDWLRTFLTLDVIVHHCVCAYLGSGPWTAKRKDDTALWLLSQLFVGGNQAYFMTLFFFISGIYVTPSYDRKGARKFMIDRTLRLVVPCIFYSLLVPPYLQWWNGYVKNPTSHPSIRQAFANWLKPSWPLKYNLATGPPWFVWMLWCFNAAYVIIRLILATKAGVFVMSKAKAALAGRRARRGPGASDADDEDAAIAAKSSAPAGPYSTRATLLGGAALIFALFSTMYTARIVAALQFNFKPSTFVQKGPMMQFMPEFLPVYIIAFALGIYSHPKSPVRATANLLNRLPHWAGWCLVCGGIWWVQAGWLPNTVMHSSFVGKKGDAVMAGVWLMRTFVEQSFAVVWSAGLLMLFRDFLNKRPNAVGDVINGAAYGAYLLHPAIIPLYAAALIPFWYPSFVVNAIAICVPVVGTTWLLAAGLKAIPGVDRVL
ncbi:MAG: acyltransferase 3, partial [Monoraphidium minutum]